MSMIIPEIDEIVNFYNAETVEQIARDTGFIQRESKFGGIEFLGIMTAGLFAEPDASLGRMCGMAKDITPGLEISEPGIHQRISESGVEFLKNLLSKALEISTSRFIDSDIPKLLQAFDRVCLLDSTHIPLPDSLSSIWRGSGGDGSASEMKLQLMLDYKHGEYVNISPTEDSIGVTPDHAYIKEAVKLLRKGDLAIFDLGYSNKGAMLDIESQEAYFLCRLNHQLGLYTEDEAGNLVKFDLVKELKKREGVTGPFEYEFYLVDGESSLKIRLVAEKAPDGVANERRRKVRQKAKKRKKKYVPSAKYLYLLGWSLYITNASKESLPTDAVRLVYTIRWQIELVFKAWKSYHGLTELRGKRPERIECFIYGRLIMMVLMAFFSGSMQRYLWQTKRRELSFLKAVKYFKSRAIKALPLIANPEYFSEFLTEEFRDMCRLCKMELRKRLSTAGKVWRLDDSYA